MTEQSRKAYYEWTNPNDRDNSIEISYTNGVLVIAVTEEHAVDSYNDSFTCDISLPVDEARKLLAVLEGVL